MIKEIHDIDREEKILLIQEIAHGYVDWPSMAGIIGISPPIATRLFILLHKGMLI
jgi:hypothetical protein